jgi:hypothetical protein
VVLVQWVLAVLWLIATNNTTGDLDDMVMHSAIPLNDICTTCNIERKRVLVAILRTLGQQ